MGDAEKEGTKRKKETGVGGNVNECVCVCVCVCVHAHLCVNGRSVFWVVTRLGDSRGFLCRKPRI